MLSFNTFLNFIFPNFCLGCLKKDTVLCDKCLSKIPLTNERVDKNIFSVFEYRNAVIRKMIWSLKYRGHKILATKLAQILHDKILEELSDLQTFDNFMKPLLIPIPLSKERLKERGFNQASIIIEQLQSINNIFSPAFGVLIKIKDTPNQASLKNKKERKENIKNCFEVKFPEKIKGRNIILIDDVTTTGATIKEARKVLSKAGAKKVIAFTVAH